MVFHLNSMSSFLPLLACVWPYLESMNGIKCNAAAARTSREQHQRDAHMLRQAIPKSQTIFYHHCLHQIFNKGITAYAISFLTYCIMYDTSARLLLLCAQ